jgi:hypothetical protein
MEFFLQLEAKSSSRRGPLAFVAFVLLHFALEKDMGKYFIGWLLGVPAIVLVGIYLIAHL